MQFTIKEYGAVAAYIQYGCFFFISIVGKINISAATAAKEKSPVDKPVCTVGFNCLPFNFLAPVIGNAK